MIPPPFYIKNKSGKLRIGKIIRVKKIDKNGITLEKPYDASTMVDISKGTRRVAHELFFVKFGDGK